MKKVLLTAAAASLLSTSAFATENAFFVKAEGGMSRFVDVKYSAKVASAPTSAKFKAKNSGFVGVGVGYFLMENVRFDLTYNHYFKPKYDFEFFGVKSGKVETNVDSLLINGFVDVFESGEFKAFVGAGFGVSKVGAKIKLNNNVSYKLKNKTKASFAAYIGGSYAISEGVDLDLTYSFKYLGKSRSFGNSFNSFEAPKLASHNIGLGVRFEI